MVRITASPNAQEPTKQMPVKVKKKPLDALLDATIHRHVELFSHMKDMDSFLHMCFPNTSTARHVISGEQLQSKIRHPAHPL